MPGRKARGSSRTESRRLIREAEASRSLRRAKNRVFCQPVKPGPDTRLDCGTWYPRSPKARDRGHPAAGVCLQVLGGPFQGIVRPSGARPVPSRLSQDRVRHGGLVLGYFRRAPPGRSWSWWSCRQKRRAAGRPPDWRIALQSFPVDLALKWCRGIPGPQRLGTGGTRLSQIFCTPAHRDEAAMNGAQRIQSGPLPVLREGLDGEVDVA